jgi:hypothetical protein
VMSSQRHERELPIQRGDGPGLQVRDGQIGRVAVGGMRGDDALGRLVEGKLNVVPVRAHVGGGSERRRQRAAPEYGSTIHGNP